MYYTVAYSVWQLHTYWNITWGKQIKPKLIYNKYQTHPMPCRQSCKFFFVCQNIDISWSYRLVYQEMKGQSTQNAFCDVTRNSIRPILWKINAKWSQIWQQGAKLHEKSIWNFGAWYLKCVYKNWFRLWLFGVLETPWVSKNVPFPIHMVMSAVTNKTNNDGNIPPKRLETTDIQHQPYLLYT